MTQWAQIVAWIGKIGEVIAEPLAYVFDPSRRVHIVFLASSLLLAVGLYVATRGTTRGLGRYLFHPKLWWSRSAKLDYKLLFANGVIRKVLFAPLIAQGSLTQIDPWPQFCSDTTCTARHDGAIWYFDSNHMTNTAARALAPLLAPVFETAPCPFILP